jgi:hypothetical protein
MDMIFDLGKVTDIDELEQLYNDLNDHLAKGVNYPGWKKGILGWMFTKVINLPLVCMKNVVLNILIPLTWDLETTG